MKTILILYGGCSSEYGVSLQSAQAVLDHLNPQRWQALPVHITRTGQWTYEGLPCALRLDRGRAALLLADGRHRPGPAGDGRSAGHWLRHPVQRPVHGQGPGP